MTIGDLTYSLGAVWDKASLKNIKDGLKTLASTFIASVAAASAAVTAIFGAVAGFASANDELGKLAKNRNIAVGSLQAIREELEHSGVSGDKAASMLEKLQEQQAKFKDGSADYEAFGKLGIDPTTYKDTESYFKAVIDRLKSVKDHSLQADLSKRLLGGSDFSNFIEGGSEAIERQKKLLKERGILLTDQDYKTAAKFNDTLQKTTTLIKGLANKALTKLMPLFTALMEQFYAFIGANGELISSGLKEFLSAVIEGSKFFLSLITRVIGQLLGFKPALILIAGLLFLWQLPLIITIGIITALFILVDELFNFFKNEDSLIGDWLGVDGIDEFKTKFPKITATIQSVVEASIAVFNYFKESVSGIFSFLMGNISFSEFLGGQIDAVKTLLNSIKNIFLDFVNYIVGLFKNLDIFSGFKDSLKGMKNSLSSFIPDLPSMDSTLSFMGVAPSANANAQTATTNNSNANNTYNIEATIDAKDKTMSEVLSEISQTSGYGNV